MPSLTQCSPTQPPWSGESTHQQILMVSTVAERSFRAGEVAIVLTVESVDPLRCALITRAWCGDDYVLHLALASDPGAAPHCTVSLHLDALLADQVRRAVRVHDALYFAESKPYDAADVDVVRIALGGRDNAFSVGRSIEKILDRHSFALVIDN